MKAPQICKKIPQNTKTTNQTKPATTKRQKLKTKRNGISKFGKLRNNLENLTCSLGCAKGWWLFGCKTDCLMPAGWLCFFLFRSYNLFLSRRLLSRSLALLFQKIECCMWKCNFACSNNFSALIWCELMHVWELGVLVALHLKLLRWLSLWHWSPSTHSCVFWLFFT